MTNTTDRRQGLIGDLGVKRSVKVATTVEITLEGLQTIDTVSLVEGDRVLVKNQSDLTKNGIYVASTGAWSRSLDFDGNGDIVNGILIFVTSGSVNISRLFSTVVTDPITVGSSNIQFNFAVAFGNAGLIASNNLSDVADKPTARDNLGLEIGVDIPSYFDVSKYSSGNFYADSSIAANTYILSKASSLVNPVNGSNTYYEGMVIEFIPNYNNTGASTVNINGAGAVSLKEEDGVTDIGSNFIRSGLACRFVYSGSVFKSARYLPANYPHSPSFRNKIINGSFDVWQRGTSFTSIADAAYSADRFQYTKSGSMVHDITRSSDVPSLAVAGRIFPYSLKISCTTADTNITSTKYSTINHCIEGYNWMSLAQKPTTKQILVKSSKAGTFCISLRNSGNDRSCVTEVTIGSGEVNTWVKKSVNFPASPSAGTWNYTNGVGILISIVLAAGSNIQTTAGSWQTGLYIASANQTNFCDSTSNEIYICGLQLEEGNVATPFESRSISDILTQCRRYYRKSYAFNTALGTATANGALTFLSGLNSCAGTYSFDSLMRSAPTTRYWDLAGNLSRITANNVNNTTIGAGGITSEENHLYVDIAPTVAVDKTIKFHFDANSEF